MADFTDHDIESIVNGSVYPGDDEDDLLGPDPDDPSPAAPRAAPAAPDSAAAVPASRDAGTGAGPRPPGIRPPSARLLWIIGGVVAVIALVAAGVVTWQVTQSDSAAVRQVSGTRMVPDPQDHSLIDFTDPGTRIRLRFPASWSTKGVGGADVRLLAGPGGGDLMSVRVVTLDTGSSSAPSPSSVRPYLDTIVEQPTVRIVQRDQIVMDGLKGWYYVYTFTDSTTRKEGVHAQYFLLRGSELYSIVFQALPATGFSRLAPVYQKVANSIQFY